MGVIFTAFYVVLLCAYSINNNLKLDLFILTTLVYSAELLTDFRYTNFIVSYRDASGRLRVHLNTSLLVYMPTF